MADGLPWEAVRHGNQQWYILRDYPTPEGYSPSKASMAFILPPTYPSTQIDMVYFHPALTRDDGKIPNQLTGHNFDGKTWQRWSRHRPTPNDWQDGVDYLATHIVYIISLMEEELGK